MNYKVVQSANAFRSVESDEVQKLSITLLKDGHCLIFFVMLMDLKRFTCVNNKRPPPLLSKKNTYIIIYIVRDDELWKRRTII